MIDENAPVADRVITLVNTLRQENLDQDYGSDSLPDEIIEAFVDHIIVHESSFGFMMIYEDPDSELRKRK